MSIVVEKLSHIYMKGTPFEKAALKDLSFRIDSGEFVGIIGHTGSGKSTLIQHFNGLLKPTSGKAFVNGMDIAGKNLKELRKQVGIVFQYPEHQLFEETVFKDVAFGLQKHGLNSVETGERVENAIRVVGLKEDILMKSPFELSGGQKRRVAIAGITKILVSHSMEDVAKHVKRVIVMNKGSIEMDGDTADIFKDAARLEHIGLLAPQITYLMKKLKNAFPDMNENIFTIKDAREEITKYLAHRGHGG